MVSSGQWFSKKIDEKKKKKIFVFNFWETLKNIFFFSIFIIFKKQFELE